MIIGKDKEKVRLLEAHVDHSRELFGKMDAVLMEIVNALRKEGVDVTKPPYCNLAYYSGRCQAMSEILSGA